MPWLVFWVALPQLRKTYELRLRYGDGQSWDCLVFVEGMLKDSIHGDAATTAADLWGTVFAAIDAPGLIPARD